MNDESSFDTLRSVTVPYIETAQDRCHTERIDAVLERRMKEFLLARRRKIWHEEGR